MNSMQGIEYAYCDTCIKALVSAWRALMEASGAEALRKTRYGKGDTLGLDAVTELAIINRINKFDKHAIIITEELDDQARRRWPTDSDPVKQPMMFFCDPTDRSVQLKSFLERIAKKDPTAKVGLLLKADDTRSIWEEHFKEAPAVITASTGAITCVRKGEVIFSVILGYITGIVYVACDLGVYSYPLKDFADPGNEELTLEKMVEHGKQLLFPSAAELGYSPDHCKQFVTFLGKNEVYVKNFEDSMLFVENPYGYIHHKEPPGPPRPLFLSELQDGHGPVGFILSNGEKIGEWMHWLPFVKFAKCKNGNQALRAFEIALERPWTKDCMLMSTSAEYSLFSELEEKQYLDISRLRNYKRPSQFRCMLVVVRHDNERIIYVLQQQEHREVTGYF